MDHVRSIVEQTGMMGRWSSGRANSIGAIDGGYRVQIEGGREIDAKNVVLALGVGDQPNWPTWARQLKGEDSRARVYHIFAPGFSRAQIDGGHDVIVVGAGISASQFALSLLEEGTDRQITMVSRHFLRKEDFDSDPGWLGPKLLSGFHRERDYGERRSMIQNARNRGSLASEVMGDLQNAILKDKAIAMELAEVEGASFEPAEQRLRLDIRPFELDEVLYQKAGAIEFSFGARTQSLGADAIVLATGFEARRPGGALVDSAVQNLGLPTAEDGFPILDCHLSWREGLFVMGALAELEVGPASRNISGARMAAERIIVSPAVANSLGPPVFRRGLRSDNGMTRQGGVKVEVADLECVGQS